MKRSSELWSISEGRHLQLESIPPLPSQIQLLQGRRTSNESTIHRRSLLREISIREVKTATRTNLCSASAPCADLRQISRRESCSAPISWSGRKSAAERGKISAPKRWRPKNKAKKVRPANSRRKIGGRRRKRTSHLEAGKMCLFFSYQCLSTTFPAWDCKGGASDGYRMNTSIKHVLFCPMNQ